MTSRIFLLSLSVSAVLASGCETCHRSPGVAPVAAASVAEGAAPTDSSDVAIPAADQTLRIIVKWGTESAVDNFGYNIYRTDEPTTGTWSRINATILGGIGTTATPYVFRYLDTDVGTDLDKTWYYKVEEIGLDGRKTYFAHPVTGESPFILQGKPKVLSEEERGEFAEGPYQKQTLER